WNLLAGENMPESSTYGVSADRGSLRLSQSAAPENLPSYAFGSARNTTASGNPVPICYGKRRWGGAIISASIYSEDKI
ncbi:hypothetical protein OFL46_36630, partial [Pseudomonas aeruginosa]|nr:hypothetical protein [Pseudomonas aeruginosa]MCV6443290.1 hypothetical protein [Pseudomonas aeruginosa]